MKLTAFRIENFRSIKDTKWNNLAHDNITCLIGQNESGKTSVLEGLKAFHDGILIEDMLRSDLTLPVVTCKFKFSIAEFENSIDMNRLQPEIRKALNEIDSISLSRVWEPGMSSYLTTGNELAAIFNAEEEKRAQRESTIQKLIEKFSNDYKKASLAVEKAKQAYEDTEYEISVKQNEINELKKTSRSLFSKSSKKSDTDDLENINQDLKRLEEERNSKKIIWEEKSSVLVKMHDRQLLKERLSVLQLDTQEKRNELTKARNRFQQISEIVGMYPSERELRTAEATQEQHRLEIDLAKDDLDEVRMNYDILLLAGEQIFNGVPFEEAMAYSTEEMSKFDNFMGSVELGEEIFKFCPAFEIFEDFSSLLPNRIDLEDIVTGNTAVEGYKAALNFLTITGLDYNFFQQPSSRILKQKIENMNGEITLNFQDFWRQNVGKNNKIKINFELANYDHSHAEKSGKPFVEFWIKDESERLYPKQRSRGVRWFLSFFMELKATAIDKSRQNSILLIDEPGVSLHARAQEDVLKVFDDIRESMQIIYTTHSPHLIDVNKLYRVIAVQRAVEDDMNSETLLMNARTLKSATADTLSPVYAMMGARLNQQDVIKSFNNVVVKDLSTYYFLKAILMLTGYKEKECYFLPASGTASMPMIINILIGWGLEYIALNFGNEEEKFVYNKLRKELFDNNVDQAELQLIYIREFADVEDLFSTIDFKKYIIHVREGITEKNSEYLKDNSESRAVVASNLLQNVTRGEIQFNDFDDESRDNLKMLMDRITLILK
ncbi:MAG: AAA family ATPase [Bacteroidales bacterium]